MAVIPSRARAIENMRNKTLSIVLDMTVSRDIYLSATLDKVFFFCENETLMTLRFLSWRTGQLQ